VTARQPIDSLLAIHIGTVKIAPTPITAAFAGAVAGILMPIVWSRFDADTLSLVAAFLLVVALPAHAFVLGFSQSHAAKSRTVDTALLKRVAAWLGAAAVTVVLAQAVHA
jgi:hypothetical protein